MAVNKRELLYWTIYFLEEEKGRPLTDIEIVRLADEAKIFLYEQNTKQNP